MKPTRYKSPTVLPSDSLVPLESVVCTEELHRRPQRPPDYETENRALVSLAQALADSPRTILQTLADKILEVLQAGSAGISLLTTDNGGKSFYWPAIAGAWNQHIGGGTPRDFGPCGDVLDRNAPLLFKHFERRYAYFLPVTPLVQECLLAPFYVEGKAAGTIWAITHDDRRKFDAEDLRQLVSLSSFASSAYQAAASLNALGLDEGALRQTHTELAQRVAELQKTNVEGQAARRAALNLMEDAVQSRQAMETLNAALRESEERYRTLFAAAPMAVFVCDRNAVIQHYNRHAMELWGREPVCGAERYCGSVKLWLPDGTLLPHTQSPMVEVLRTGIPALNVEVSVERPDSSRLPVLVNCAALKNAQGEITGAITSFMDITERKKAEEERALLLAREQQARQEAEEANRAKDEFLATISHELRTPLNAMLGWVQMLSAGKLEEAEVAPALETIERNARAQNRLITDLLDSSRIIMGKLRLELGPVELIPVIEAALKTVRPAAEAKGVELRLELDPKAGPVLGDADRLQQIVWNLLANAIKYTPRGGHVETRLEREGASVAIIVCDTGDGIAPEFLPYVFARFRQADVTTTRQHGGLGLGLAIVRHLVEAHGGQVSASSEGAGQGATFTVALPLMTSPNTDFGLRDKDMVEQSAILTGLRVLVVDDNPDARELLRSALTKHGFDVRVGATARAALEILEQWQPEVLVSDIGMPGEDGYDLIRHVRSLPDDRGGQIPAVALTGYASTKDAARVLAAGYQVFMPKPVELAELVVAITSVVEHFGIDQSS
jgi:PAS domain S-box-containing protein